MSEPTYMLWYDLETTGTDENQDNILEIGCVLTDIDGRTIDTYQAVMLTDTWAFTRLMNNDAVREMHTQNGLLQEVHVRGHNVQSVDRSICDWITRHTGSTNHILGAGSGVAHFDRRFLKVYMPQLDKRLTYYSLDVGVLRRACRLAGREDLVLPDAKNHRALVDACHHLDEWRHYKAILAGAMPPVPADPYLLDDAVGGEAGGA